MLGFLRLPEDHPKKPNLRKMFYELIFKENEGYFEKKLFHPVRTLILMDATGSMTMHLNNAKNSVFEFFNRVKEIISSKGYEENVAQI
jgi:hypothetical protein